ncbi:hypothetical protein Mal48_05790 [Thalassoglobus polymorphus]|uniref:Uncharacterized protein n=1 Tax=Thalassoglobus polymorphus TaxID=2527994 RepID=A0A517QI83_9PLAN|nr:hypothetical protein Mal48_05790 [Thalassoglobus polymorphus]
MLWSSTNIVDSVATLLRYWMSTNDMTKPVVGSPERNKTPRQQIKDQQSPPPDKSKPHEKSNKPKTVNGVVWHAQTGA